MRLSNAMIAALKLPDGTPDKVFFDPTLSGFGVRVRTSGAKSWHVQYDLHGRTRRMSLGSVAVMTLTQARAAAREILARVKLDEDPAGDKAENKAKAKDTVGALVERYLERKRQELKPRSFLEVERHLRCHVAPLHTSAISKLDRRIIASLLETIADNSGPAAANRVRSSLTAFLGWCVGSGHSESNPADYVPKAIENGPRKRLLDDGELAAIWWALGDDPHSVIVRLLLLTGLRRTEIGGLRWDEIDFDDAEITLPPERTKSKRKWVVPLSPPALALLKAQSNKDEREHVFGLRDTGFSDWSGSKAELDAKLAAAGHKLAPWTLHDFRRAISTTLNERLGVRPEVVEVILGHVLPGIAGVYNLAEHVAERRRALEKWAAHIDAVASGEPSKAVSHQKKKVVQLHSKRRY